MYSYEIIQLQRQIQQPRRRAIIKQQSVCYVIHGPQMGQEIKVKTIWRLSYGQTFINIYIYLVIRNRTVLTSYYRTLNIHQSRAEQNIIFPLSPVSLSSCDAILRHSRACVTSSNAEARLPRASRRGHLGQRYTYACLYSCATYYSRGPPTRSTYYGGP